MTAIRDEFALIRDIAALCPTRGAAVRVPLNDDAAVAATPPNTELVVTTDTLTEDVHFSAQTITFQELGWKLAAVNLSDLAAMGAQPLGIVVALALPQTTQKENMISLYRGLGECLRTYDALLLGGDTVHSRHGMTLTATALGYVPCGQAVTRNGAQPGDRIVLTGPTGYAALAYYLLARGLSPEASLRAFQNAPRPQLAKGKLLRELGATAMNDISDGLAFALGDMAKQSEVRFEVEQSALIWQNDLAQRSDPHALRAEDLIWYGGEDFELAATLPATSTVPQGMYEIGRVTKGSGLFVCDGDTCHALQVTGYNHFGGI